MRNTITDREHRLENGTGSVTAYTPHFARRRHIHTQYRVCLLQAVEGELRSLDSYVIEVEEVLVRLLYRNAEHHFRSQFDKVDFKYLAYERERTAGTQVTFNHLDVVVFGEILNIERTGDIQFPGNLPTDTLDATYRLHIKLLRRKLDSGIAGMYAGKLYMLADSIRDDFPILRYGIHFHFLGMLYELAHDYRMLLRYVCRQLQEAFQLFLIGANVHCRTG